MKHTTEHMTGERAWELSRWCSENSETLRDLCRSSEEAARIWWENEIDRPEELSAKPEPRADMLSFAESLQAEGYRWAEEAGSLFAEKRGIDATVRVDSFTPADDDDGPFEGEELTAHSPAVALRFDFDAELVGLLKTLFHGLRHSRRSRGQLRSHTVTAGGWSDKSRCWWVRSTYWQQVRQALLDKGVKLVGPL